jgi:hypothetical protein
MLSAYVKEIFRVLDWMINLELTISELYQSCAEVWPEEKDFWSVLAQAELQHVANIKKMVDIVAKKPKAFQKGRPFTTAGVNTALSGLKDNIQKIKNGEITKTRALFIAWDFEESLLEFKYGEIVKTNDIEYCGLLDEIVSQTVVHRNYINGKIKNAKRAS